MADHIRYGAPRYWHELQAWLAHESDEERLRLAAALESADEADYYSAAFELFLTQHIVSQGWAFTRHPTLEWTTKRPDYLVHHPDGEFLLEAAVVLDSDQARNAERVRNTLRDALDTVTGPFDVIMTIDGRYDGQHSANAVADWLRERLAALTLSEDASRDLVYDADGFRITFTVFASEVVESPVIVVENLTGSVAANLTTHEAIKDSLDAKQSRYGRPPMPYVVALDVQTQFPVEPFSLTRALYGTAEWHFSEGAGGLAIQGETHRRDGMLSAHDGAGNPIRTRISAVAMYRRQHERDDLVHHDLVLCHHPFASRPLGREVFRHLPQLLPTSTTNEEVVLRWNDDPEPPHWARRG